MKVAILSDIHSNLEALQACLDIIQEHALNGAIVLLGNHDAATISDQYKKIEVMNFVARDAIYWTRSQLREDQRAFLRDLPLTVRTEGGVFYAHASADEPSRWHYPESVKKPLEF